MSAVRTIRLCAFGMLLALSLAGCGGGSSGTGVPDGFVAKVLTGRVADDSNAPVAGAHLTVLETGDSTLTDSAGRFEVELQPSAPDDLSLEVRAGAIASTLLVPSKSEAGSRIELEIQISRRQGTVSAKGLSVTAKVVGDCDFAFDNNAVIRQGVALASGKKCPLRVTVRNPSGGLSGIPFRMEHSKCAAGKWKLVGEGLTNSSGVGNLNFTYFDNDEYCDYRVIVPFEFKGLKSQIFPFRTFRRQHFDKGSPTALDLP